MIRRLSAFTVVLLLTVGVSVVGFPTASAAADLSGLVTVEVTDVRPLSPKPGDELTVSGVLRNSTTVPLRDVGVRLVADGDPVTSTSEAFTYALDDVPVDGQTVAQRPGFVSLAPGETSQFELSVPFDELALPGPGVYPIGIDSVDGRADVLGRATTLVPWYPPGSVTQSAEVTFLWPLVGTPARDADDVFISNTPTSEIDRGGRLRDLLAVGARYASAVSWVIDPQTVQSVELLARPHLELTADGAAAEVPGNPAATAWLEQLRASTSTAAQPDVTAIAYADPDSTAEVGAGLLSDLVLATTTAPDQLSDQLDRTVNGGFSWPPDGRVDQATLNALRLAGVRNVVLAPEGVSPSDSPLLTLSTDSGPITGIVGDANLSLAMLLMSQRPEEAVQARQVFFATVALSSQTLGQSTLVAVPPTTRWSAPERQLDALLSGLSSAEYADLVPIDQLLTQGQEAAQEADLGPYGQLAQAAQLPRAHMQIVAQSGEALTQIGAIAVQPGDALRPFRESLLRSSSSAWRAEPQLGAIQLARTAGQIAAQQAKVSISSAGPVAFPGEQGRVPVTVSNDLPVAVTVGLTLSATPSFRIVPEPVPPVTVPPGQRLSLEVPVRVVGPEALTVTAQLLTPEGLPYGPGEDFELRTSAYSRVAAWAVGLAFGALILMATWSTVRRFRKRAADPAAKGEPHSHVDPLEAPRDERQ